MAGIGPIVASADANPVRSCACATTHPDHWYHGLECPQSAHECCGACDARWDWQAEQGSGDLVHETRDGLTYRIYWEADRDGGRWMASFGRGAIGLGYPTLYYAMEACARTAGRGMARHTWPVASPIIAGGSFGSGDGAGTALQGVEVERRVCDTCGAPAVGYATVAGRSRTVCRGGDRPLTFTMRCDAHTDVPGFRPWIVGGADIDAPHVSRTKQGVKVIDEAVDWVQDGPGPTVTARETMRAETFYCGGDVRVQALIDSDGGVVRVWVEVPDALTDGDEWALVALATVTEVAALATWASAALDGERGGGGVAP